MHFSVSDAVKLKAGRYRMVVTGLAAGMVECRWYDGHRVQRGAFREEELEPASHPRPPSA